MEVVTIRCPFCLEHTELNDVCQVCHNDLRLMIATQNVALARFNVALKMIMEDDWDRAWQEISEAISIFPYHPDIVMLAWRLSRELGYYNEAHNILESYKNDISSDDYQNASDQLIEEVKLYNMLLTDADLHPSSTVGLMIHRRLRDISRKIDVMKEKNGFQIPVRKWNLKAVGLVIVMGVLSISPINKAPKQDSDEPSNNVQTQVQTIAKAQESIQAESMREQSLPAFIASLPSRDQEVIFRIMWNQRKYDHLSSLDNQSWFTKAAKFKLIHNSVKQLSVDPNEAKQAIESLDDWTFKNSNFPSYYGDACLTLIQAYSVPPHRDLTKKKEIAERLLRWVQNMPPEPEYQQYLNLSVLEILHE